MNIEIQQKQGDLEILKKHVKKIKAPNCYVEIGTFQGGSAVMARRFAKKDVDVYTIDPVDNRYGLKDKEKADNKDKLLGINYIQKKSNVASRIWKKPIGVLFIDGNHTKAVEDFNLWIRFVVEGGIILFHDYIESYDRISNTVKEDCDRVVIPNKRYKVVSENMPDGNITSILEVKKL